MSPRRSKRTFARLLGAALFAALGAVSLGGCASYTPAENARLFAQQSPPVHLTKPGEHIRSAERQASQSPHSFVLVGSGRSMEPAYPQGTALVVQEHSYRHLRPGMGVVYRNTEGFYVAHMVLERLPKGWLAMGLNSPAPDDELVTPRNFVGVITSAFIPQ